jgi:hypothetical protein
MMSRMKKLVVQLSGGLGNQLFQYAAARTLADRESMSLILDCRFFQNDIYGRTFELDALNVRFDGIDNHGIVKLPENIPTWMRRIVWKLEREYLYAWKYPYSAIRESPKEAWRRTLEDPDGLYMKGYFQSELYFTGNARLANDFTMKAEMDQENKRILEEIKANPCSVCLHLRQYKGDLKSHKSQKHLNDCTAEYFAAAIDRITGIIKNPHFYVFSNDLGGLDARLLDGKEYSVVSHNKGGKGVFDWALMRECRHFIISNSTYSWWAAWLGEASSKKVIAPRRWFSKKAGSDSGIYPKEWILI